MVQNEPKKPRGRPRAYDPPTALSRATEAFWHAGYAGTSLDDLCAAMCMNRPSLYGAFGDKRTLYLKALDRYIEVAGATLLEALDYERPLAEGLGNFYARALALYHSGEGPARGCFLICTAATESIVDAEVRAKLGEGLGVLNAAIEARIRHARTKRELAASADPTALAGVASAVLHSLAVRARAGDSRAKLKALAESALRLICGKTPLRARKRTRRRRQNVSAHTGRLAKRGP